MHIKNILLSFLYILGSNNTIHSFTIMLDPYGDAQHTGRVIDGAFERGITLQCTEYLKKEINQKFPDMRVIISRVPGEIVEPLQNASFANKLQVDLFISFCFYHTEKIPTPVHIYFYEKNPADTWHKPEQLAWYSVDNIYLAHLGTTKKFVETLYTIFDKPLYKSVCMIHAPIGIPCLQLKGINAPACSIEMGLLKKDDWKTIVPAFLEFIGQVHHE